MYTRSAALAQALGTSLTRGSFSDEEQQYQTGAISNFLDPLQDMNYRNAFRGVVFEFTKQQGFGERDPNTLTLSKTISMNGSVSTNEFRR